MKRHDETTKRQNDRASPGGRGVLKSRRISGNSSELNVVNLKQCRALLIQHIGAL